jgi:hypothetical protein
MAEDHAGVVCRPASGVGRIRGTTEAALGEP